MIPDSTLARIGNRLSRILAPPAPELLVFDVDGARVGLLSAARAARLRVFPDVFRVDTHGVTFVAALRDADSRTNALARVAQSLASDGALSAWRDERYAIAPSFGAAPWFLLERAAARYFGVHTYASHVNGLVREDAGVSMWLARRSGNKAIDPGMLDNLVGGGIAAGATVAATLVKEAWEEAGIDATLAATSIPAGTVEIFRAQPDGIQRETIFVHDLWLPPVFEPANQDGEVSAHRQVSLDEAARLIAIEDGTDTVTADAALVALDCLLRNGAIPRDSPHRARLAALGACP